MIPKETIDNILLAVRVEEIIADYVNLKKKGVNYVGCCPFHNEKTASLVVSPVKNIYKCFGCGEGGNAVNFVMKHDGISYPAALKQIASKYNIIIDSNESSEDKEKYGLRDSLKHVSKWAMAYFNSNTIQKEVAEYLKIRNINSESIEEFQLGFALSEWNELEKAAKTNGYTTDILIAAGLIKKGEHNTYDFFRNRIMFPYLDLTGNTVGFTGRDISDKKEVAKYQNSPETDIFNKGNLLYGLSQAKKDIINHDQCFLVEGNIDVISFHQKTIKNTVCASGTAFTHTQAQIIKRFTNNVIIVYDGDPAGIKATFKNIDILLENGLNVKAVILPDGEDPDSFAQKNTPEKLIKYLKDKAKDFITLKFEMLSEDNDDPAKDAGIAKQIIESIALIPEDVIMHFYRRLCIEKFKFSAELLSDQIKKLRKEKLKASKKEIEVKNGWIGLDFALEQIKENDECLITLNQEKLISHISGEHENTVCHQGIIENIHIQELNKTTQNIILIDFIDSKDIEDETKIIQLGKMLFKNRMNVKVFTNEGNYVSFLDHYVLKSNEYIKEASGDDLVKKNQIEKTAELLSHADNTRISISVSFIAKQYGIKEAAFNNILKPFLAKRKTKILMSQDGILSSGKTLTFDPDRLPDWVDKDFLRRYGYFPAQADKDSLKVGYVFETQQGGLMTVANFFMEPLFHVYNIDPSKNKRIVQINNGEQNKQFFTELTSDSMIDFNAFKKCMWREGGNVFTKGKPIHFEMILASLANQFPLCYELSTFGQQHEDFFAFTNAIFSNDKIKFTNEYGLVEHNGKIYYSPAFSKIYSGQRKDDDKYEQDRYFIYKENKETDFATWADLMNKVYAANDNGKWAVVMSLLSAFRSVIYPIDRLFTSLFFIGPTESGKTQLAVSLRSLFMAPEAPLFNLNSGTDAAFFATLERYRDIPIIFEEYNDYQISDIKFQGLKAAVYDGEGKTKRKDATSKDLDVSKVYGVPLLLGQEGPERDDGSLGNRCVIKQVPKKQEWNETEISLFQNLKRREKNGLTNILIEILRTRPFIIDHFAKRQRETFKELKNNFREKGIVVENRIVNTVSLFTAMVKVMEVYVPHLKLPFSYSEFFDLASAQIIAQSEQILSTNRLSGFFESIEILMLREKLLNGRDFKIELQSKVIIMINSKETTDKDLGRQTKVLFLRINNIHEHYKDLKKTEALKMGNLMAYMKDHPAFIGQIRSTRFEWQEFRDAKDALDTYVKKQSFKASANTSAVALNYEILRSHVNIDFEKYNEIEKANNDQEDEINTIQNKTNDQEQDTDIPF